jgi:uncharacterized membrane protein
MNFAEIYPYASTITFLIVMITAVYFSDKNDSFDYFIIITGFGLVFGILWFILIPFFIIVLFFYFISLFVNKLRK